MMLVFLLVISDCNVTLHRPEWASAAMAADVALKGCRSMAMDWTRHGIWKRRRIEDWRFHGPSMAISTAAERFAYSRHCGRLIRCVALRLVSQRGLFTVRLNPPAPY